METSTTKGFEGIPTGIRRLVLAGNKDEIPHVLYIVNPKTTERFELIVTIAGRILLCFECKHTGHCRSECFTPYCRRCGTYGHTFESCTSANTYSSAVRGASKQQASSTAGASIDEDRQYAYRDGGVESVEGGSGWRVVSNGSSTGDPDTRSAGTTVVRMHAAESAGCSSPPAAYVDPLDPAAHVARVDGIPTERLLPPVEAQATDPVSTKPISTEHDAASESDLSWRIAHNVYPRRIICINMVFPEFLYVIYVDVE